MKFVILTQQHDLLMRCVKSRKRWSLLGLGTDEVARKRGGTELLWTSTI